MYLDGSVWIAVGDSILQDIVKNSSKLHGIPEDTQVILCLQFNCVSVAFKEWIKFISQLHQHEGDIKRLLFQNDLLEIIAGNLKEFIDQLL